MPYFPFYPTDWHGDFDLQTCSLEARGLLIELIGLMHESEKYGFLVKNGVVLDHKNVASWIQIPPKKVKKAWNELLEKRVLSVDDTGTIYSRRMVRDAEVRAKKREAGKKGGNPKLLNQEDNHEVNQMDKHPSLTPMVNTNPSHIPERTLPTEEAQAPSVWDAGKELFGENGVGKKEAGGIIGKAIKAHGEEEVARAIAATAEKKPADPVSYFHGVLKDRKDEIDRNHGMDPDVFGVFV